MLFVRAIFFVLLWFGDDLIFSASAIQNSGLYPYGLNAGDTRLTPTRPGAQDEDISSDEIKLKTNIKFYSNEYGAIYVSIYTYYFS